MGGVLRATVWIGLLSLAGLGLVLAYMGAFARVVIDEQTVGPFRFVYRETTSTTLSEVGAITTDIDSRLRAAGVTGARPFDVFQPPGGGPHQIGFVLPAADPALASRLGGGVLMRDIPAQRSMVTRFPWKNRLSFVIGFLKVDPALRRYRQAHGYTQTAAYALNEGRTIAYMQPIVAPAPTPHPAAR